MRVKKFDQFLLENYSSLLLEGTSKEDSYRSIALKVAEIFSLFGFFVAIEFIDRLLDLFSVQIRFWICVLGVSQRNK